MYKKYTKRILDILFATIALLILSPIMIIVTLWLALGNNETKPFFLQRRPGKHGKIFSIIKFRTMTEETDTLGSPLPDDVRLTKTGKLIREYSIDELPQLINVIRGEMSIVGPRPLLEQYLPLYTKEQNRRHEVLPGITGWAQCHGRNEIDWEEKLSYDIWYVDHCSFLTDIKILFLTLSQVLLRKGISHHDNATMPLFSGTYNDDYDN